MSKPATSRFLSSLAALAAAVSPSRPGTNTPGASAPLAGAPPPATGGTRSIRQGLLRGSLRACTAEGLFAELVNAFAGGALLTGWAIYLGAGPLYTGLLVALPQVAQVLHIPGAWTTALLGHRRACLWLVGTSRQLLLPLALLPFLPIGDEHRRLVLLLVAAVSAALGVLGNNAWVAWMGELVPRRIRGRYFGRRTGLCMLGGALASAVVGVLLDAARPRGLIGPTLAGLQVLACLCGLVTVVLMRRQHDPSPDHDPPPLRLGVSLQPLRDAGARGLFLYQAAWNVAVGLAGSFFALHMLVNLKMGFALVALHGATTAAFRMIAAPMWGALIDRLGARPVLAACSFAISGIPLLWLLPTESRLWPLAVDAALAGTFWSGHSLAVFALPLAVTQRRQRPFFVAALAAVGGLAFAAATATAGALASWLPARIAPFGLTIHSLEVLFVVSGALRLGASFLALRIHEPAGRPVGDVLRRIKGDLAGHSRAVGGLIRRHPRTGHRAGGRRFSPAPDPGRRRSDVEPGAQTVALHLEVQGLVVDPQDARGLALVAVGLLQHLGDGPLLGVGGGGIGDLLQAAVAGACCPPARPRRTAAPGSGAPRSPNRAPAAPPGGSRCAARARCRASRGRAAPGRPPR